MRFFFTFSKLSTALFMVWACFCLPLFAQQSYDKLVFMDSTSETVIVKSVLPPEIQYADYDTFMRKEGVLHSVSVMQVARIEYANGRKESHKEWMATLQSKEVAKTAALIESYKNVGGVINPPQKEEKKEPEPFKPSLIMKTNLAKNVVGFVNVGVERSFSNSLSIEGYLGYVSRRVEGSYTLTENNRFYGVDATIRAAGVFNQMALKWYPGMSNRRLDYLFHFDRATVAPHGWNLALRQQTNIIRIMADFSYPELDKTTQSSGGLTFDSITTLDLGYQQTRILKIFTWETFFGLGYKFLTYPKIDIVTPAGNKMLLIPRSGEGSLAFSWGVCLGLDINALKK